MQTILTDSEMETLWNDKAYGILTRPALEIMYNRRVANGEKHYAILIDLDGIHPLNAKNAELYGGDGYSVTDQMIRQAFENIQMRDTDLVLAGRHKSGDEVSFLIRITGDPQLFCERLQACLVEQGLSATMAYVVAQPDYEATMEQAGTMMVTAKRLNERGTISK